MAEDKPKRRRVSAKAEGPKPTRTRRIKGQVREAFRDAGLMAEAEIELDEEETAVRAYHIAHSPHRGSDEENWLRAERELRAERATRGA